MQSRPTPLLCELHAHTTWSDGALSIRELVDLYGRRGFDVLSVTDHATRDGREVDESSFRATSTPSRTRQTVPGTSIACS